MSLKLASVVPKEWAVIFRACWTAARPGTGTALATSWRRPWRALPPCSGRQRSVSAYGWRNSRGSTRTKIRPRTLVMLGSRNCRQGAKGHLVRPRPAHFCPHQSRLRLWRHIWWPGRMRVPTPRLLTTRRGWFPRMETHPVKTLIFWTFKHDLGDTRQYASIVWNSVLATITKNAKLCHLWKSSLQNELLWIYYYC